MIITPWAESAGLTGIEFVSRAHVHDTGKHCYVLNEGVPVRGDLGVRREFHPRNEGGRLSKGPLYDGNLRACRQVGGRRPLQVGRDDHHVIASRVLRKSLWSEESAGGGQSDGGWQLVFHSVLHGCHFGRL
jgi:hypothetical protein